MTGLDIARYVPPEHATRSGDCAVDMVKLRRTAILAGRRPGRAKPALGCVLGPFLVEVTVVGTARIGQDLGMHTFVSVWIHVQAQ